MLVVTRLEPEKAEKPEKPEKVEKPSRKERAELKAATKAEPQPVEPDVIPEDEPEFDPVEPVRETRPAARSELVRDSVRMLPSPPAIPAQRGPDAPVVVARVDDFALGPAPAGPGRQDRATGRGRAPPGAAEHRHPQRAHPDPPARARVHRGRRLRGLRWRLLRPRAPAHAGADLRPRRPAAPRPVRRPLRHRRDRGPSGLRGRAGHRDRRWGPRDPHRPALEPAGGLRARPRDGLGRGEDLQRHPPGAGQPRSGCGRQRRSRGQREPQRQHPEDDAGASRDHCDRARVPRSSYATGTGGSCGPASSRAASTSRSSGWRPST